MCARSISKSMWRVERSATVYRGFCQMLAIICLLAPSVAKAGTRPARAPGSVTNKDKDLRSVTQRDKTGTTTVVERNHVVLEILWHSDALNETFGLDVNAGSLDKQKSLILESQPLAAQDAAQAKARGDKRQNLGDRHLMTRLKDAGYTVSVHSYDDAVMELDASDTMVITHTAGKFQVRFNGDTCDVGAIQEWCVRVSSRAPAQGVLNLGSKKFGVGEVSVKIRDAWVTQQKNGNKVENVPMPDAPKKK